MRLRFWKKPKVTSLRQHRDDWLTWAEVTLSPRTIEGYRRITDRFLDRWDDLTINDVTDVQLVPFIEEANPASRQQRRGAFANWFKWAYLGRRVTKNPMAHVPTYKQPQQEPVRCFTEAEVKTLIELPEPDGTLMAILFGSGIRKSEASHLTPRHIDFINRELHVVDGAKGGSIGVIPISTRLACRLEDYVEAEGIGPDDYFWGCNPGGSYKRRHDRPLSDGGMQKWWKRCIEASGVEYRKMHSTRHTFATVLRRRGLPMDDVSDMLRHRDPRTTKRVYVHLRAVDTRERMEREGIEALV
jgi:integrase